MNLTDGHIRLLPIHVANKIAAGEVVERPASALKELIENAIDAGSTRIDVAITAGGRKLLSVRDDGCGMNRNDALMSLERQATSKIRDVDDIEKIDTLGFRGEAIPSIAAVSRFSLTSRRKDAESGTRITVNAGTIAEISECGAPPGTCVEVRDLFCNVPARLKFLRSYATEESHVKNVFTVSALAHPDIGFSLTIDGRELYRFAPNATLEERIAGFFGNEFAIGLLPIGADTEKVHIHGYLSRPSSISTRREQFVFVNARPASAPIVAHALKEALPGSREESKPSLFLFIDLPPTDVDVNVHPAKREVRFRHPGDVKNAIVSALAATTGFCTTSAFVRPTVRIEPATTDIQPTSESQPPPAFNPAPFQPSLPPTVSAEPIEETIPTPPPACEPADSIAPPPSSAPWRSFRFLAATESGYLLIETDAGLVTINPQAAQERITYEKMLAVDSAHIVSQPLLIPETVHLSPLESSRLKSFCDILIAQGFQLEEFGRDTWKIDAVPALANGISPADLIASIVYDIGERGMRHGEKWREELIAGSVAKSLAGTSRNWTDEDATRLIEELGKTSMPYVCPRGKPVMIFTSFRELLRKFGK